MSMSLAYAAIVLWGFCASGMGPMPVRAKTALWKAMKTVPLVSHVDVRATTGSTRVERNAGTLAAATVTSVNRTAAPAKMAGSCGLTPTKRLARVPFRSG
jgi:hypothetical protein